MSVADDIKNALDERDRAPKRAEERAGLNAFIRRNASWPAARGLPAEVAEDQDRDDAGRFSAAPVTGAGLDQGGGGGAAVTRTPRQVMTERLRRAAYGESGLGGGGDD